MDDANHLPTVCEPDKNTPGRERGGVIAEHRFQQCHSTSHFCANARTSPGINTVNAHGRVSQRELSSSAASCLPARRPTTTRQRAPTSHDQKYKRDQIERHPAVLMVAPPGRDAASPAARKRIREGVKAEG